MAQAVLSDGFVSLCIDTSLNWADGKCRMLIEGQYIPVVGNGVTADEAIRVNSVRDIEAMFGVGSVLSEALKKVFCTCPVNVEVFALPRADAALGVAAAYTITITGPATSDGRFTLFMGDADYSIDVGVDAGDTATAIAALVVARIPESFPFSAVAAAGVITLTAKNKGTVGNHLNFVYNFSGRSNYAPAGVAVAVAQTTQGSVDPAPLNYADVLGDCCYSCYALLSEDTDLQEALRDHIRSAWDCTKPQCFGHGYVYNVGTASQIIADGDNSAELSRLAHCADDPILPYLKVVSYASLSCCIACDNPEISVQGQTFGLLRCISQPQSCAPCFSYLDTVALREAAFVVTGPANIGTGALTNPYIFNDVTNNLYDELGRPNETFRATNSRRLATKTALALAEKLQEFNGLGFFTINTDIKRGVQGTNKNLMLANIRAWAKTQIGVLFSEFPNINQDIQLRTDFEVAPECVGRPGLLHLFMRYMPPVRIDKVNVQMQPKLLDNCNR